MHTKLSATAALLGSLIITASFACTDFRLKANDGTLLITRTMEFAIPMNANLHSSSRDKVFQNTAPDGKPGLSWTAKYGYVYLDGMAINNTIDGMNEKGLSIEALYLPGETTYQTVPVGADAHALPYIATGDWVLSNFRTVDEVKEALKKTYVFSQKIPGKGNTVFPLHFIINDASGKSIVVEYVKGQVKIHDDPLGVATNSPTYDWQITNLRNYVNLSPNLPSGHIINGIMFGATGQGSGMNGLPGDASPPSRFVKIASLVATAIPADNTAAVLNLAQHIINNVDIPVGFVRAVENGKTNYDHTQWTVFKDLTHKIFYFRTYGDSTLRYVSLDKVDFSKNAVPLKMPIDSSNTNSTVDVTNAFLHAK